jgi:hypothetical protein
MWRTACTGSTARAHRQPRQQSVLRCCRSTLLTLCAALLQINAALEELCRELGSESVALVEAFGVPEHLLAAPIAADWVKYNAVDNKGELVGSLW